MTDADQRFRNNLLFAALLNGGITDQEPRSNDDNLIRQTSHDEKWFCLLPSKNDCWKCCSTKNTLK
jgi:hypothetical protein